MAIFSKKEKERKAINTGLNNNFIDVYKKQDLLINENTVNINMIKNTSIEYDIDITYLTNIIINQIIIQLIIQCNIQMSIQLISQLIIQLIIQIIIQNKQ